MRAFRLAGIVALAVNTCSADSLIKPNDRIIFVGDSITAQSVGGMEGYYHQFTNTLHTVYPDSSNEVISLGFSGNTLFILACFAVF